MRLLLWACEDDKWFFFLSHWKVELFIIVFLKNCSFMVQCIRICWKCGCCSYYMLFELWKNMLYWDDECSIHFTWNKNFSGIKTKFATVFKLVKFTVLTFVLHSILLDFIFYKEIESVYVRQVSFILLFFLFHFTACCHCESRQIGVWWNSNRSAIQTTWEWGC